jgi:membrane-bound metal-dependent hydrolase YbcI (DUF457 family)
MGNYRQHLTFATGLGVLYAAGSVVAVGIPWVYGTTAVMLTTLSGLLPDIDSDSGVEMKSFTGIMGVLAAVAVWHKAALLNPTPGFELHLWAVVLSYIFVRHGLRAAVARITVHRGMSHSVPTCAIWGALTYLYYPSNYPLIRAMMSLAVMLGFFSHLLLDELCSVDLHGARLNKAFGTAIKFWSPSPIATLIIYSIMGYLAWRIIEIWPDGGITLAETIPPPTWPVEPVRTLLELPPTGKP